MISVNSVWNVVNFRTNLLLALVNQGYEVVVVAPPDIYCDRLAGLSCTFIALPMDSQGVNPLIDLLLFFRFFKILWQERPATFLSYTVKPNIYGSLAAHFLGIPVINNITGLGSVFIKNGPLAQLVRWLYFQALSRSFKVFFQNFDDLRLFAESGVVNETIADILPGSGVDLQRFFVVPLPGVYPIRFLCLARMLWDKGIAEFVYAAQLLKQRGINVDCCLLGYLDVKNPTSISQVQMGEWVNEGSIRYLGIREDVFEEIAKADCVVLPSYREGTPRALLEAASMARPIITTNAIGCRDVVDDGVSGFLCRIKDANDLANKMEIMANFSQAEREIMGMHGRVKMEKEYDDCIVINKYLETISDIALLRS